MTALDSGKLLVARPGLIDPNFRRTVVLLFQHEAQFGTMGLVVNRPSPARLADVVEKIEGVKGREDLLWVGGPVQPSAVLVLHRRRDLPDPGAEVRPGLFVGGSPQLLVDLLKSSAPNPAPGVFRVLRGYAGWGPGQLQREIREGSWRVADSDADVLFGCEGEALWDDVLVRSQLPFELPSGTLRNARLN